MRVENFARFQVIIQGVHVEAILDLDQNIISSVTFVPITGKVVIIKDFDFFMQELNNFYSQIQKPLGTVRRRIK